MLTADVCRYPWEMYGNFETAQKRDDVRSANIALVLNTILHHR